MVARTLLHGKIRACISFTLSCSPVRPAQYFRNLQHPGDPAHVLTLDFLKLATYMTFFMIILTFYGLPLNIIRDVFVTARSFITRLRALVRYHNATREMDRRYPDATEAELAEMSDRTCIICREEMQSRAASQPNSAADHVATEGEAQAQAQQQPPAPPPADGPNMTPKKLPCGHIFHFQCLRSWLERQQSCPTWFVFSIHRGSPRRRV